MLELERYFYSPSFRLFYIYFLCQLDVNPSTLAITYDDVCMRSYVTSPLSPALEYFQVKNLRVKASALFFSFPLGFRFLVITWL